MNAYKCFFIQANDKNEKNFFISKTFRSLSGAIRHLNALYVKKGFKLSKNDFILHEHQINKDLKDKYYFLKESKEKILKSFKDIGKTHNLQIISEVRQ